MDRLAALSGGFVALLGYYAVGLDPGEVLEDFLLAVGGGQELVAVTVGCAIETFADEVCDAGVVMDVVFHLEAPKIETVHYNEFPAAGAMLGHDVVALA